MSHSIQHQVDSILFEEGSFSPIAWLLREGHLDIGDYQNWRKGKTDYLEDHFKTALPEIIASLKLAQGYAEKLKLDSFCQTYSSVAQQSIKACRSEANELILTTVYQPAGNRIQLDLFFDSAPVVAAQDLIRAIVDQRDDELPFLLMQLKSLDPDRHMSFNRLLTQRKKLAGYPETRSKIEFLLNVLTPSAFAVLGQFASDFLTPCWRQLSSELSVRRFDAEFPEDHLSFTAYRAFQWREVIASIEREEDWNKQPVLLFRNAEACFKLNREIQGLQNWFRLFLQYPESAEQWVGSTGNFLLLSDWRNFNDLDPELETQSFPAWMTLHKPALATIEIGLEKENTGLQSLQLIRGLAAGSGQGVNESIIELRASLRQLNPSLFVHYMALHR